MAPTAVRKRRPQIAPMPAPITVRRTADRRSGADVARTAHRAGRPPSPALLLPLLVEVGRPRVAPLRLGACRPVPAQLAPAQPEPVAVERVHARLGPVQLAVVFRRVLPGRVDAVRHELV